MTLKTLPVIQPTTPLQPSPQEQQSLLSWIFLTTRRRIIFFVIFSPVLIPLLCLSIPFICIARLYVCLCRPRRRDKRRRDDGMRRCEEGRGYEVVGDAEEREIGWLLMQRYLEDQLGLVAVYDCSQEDDEDDYYNNNYNHNNGGNLGVNLTESRRPLLV